VRVVPVVAAILLLGGCLGGTAAPSGPSSPSPSPNAPVVLDFHTCRESDFTFPAPASDLDPGPLRLRTTDPAGTTVTMIVNAITCASLDDGQTNTSRAVGYYVMVQVDPVNGLTLNGTSTYLWLVTAITHDQALRHRWAQRGVNAVDGTVDVSFQASPDGRRDARSAIRLKTEDGTASIDSTMAGDLRKGSAGRLGLYTASTVDVWLHAVEFSDYSFYATGTGVASPGPWFGAAPTSQGPEVVAASHNLDYSVKFLLDQGTVRAKRT
jgi:hypothetical protein